jgi:hypothetical protein
MATAAAADVRPCSGSRSSSGGGGGDGGGGGAVLCVVAAYVLLGNTHMPHEYMRDRQSRTVSRSKTRSPVTGQTPPLASVPASTDSCCAFCSMAHDLK